MLRTALSPLVVLVALFLCIGKTQAQTSFQRQLPEVKKYVQAEVYDSSEGIKLYEKLNPYFQGDSVRNDPRGYACSGWVEDFYKNGQMLHRGYYTEGKLKTYKNFYENGQLERHFQTDGFKTYQMTLYWDNGKVRSDITYESDFALSTHEYFFDGQPEYEEVFKKRDVLTFRHIYGENEKPETIIDIKDEKKRIYTAKEYFEDGTLKSEGEMKYHREVNDLMKDGDWKVYDQKGKVTAIEEYVNGQVTNTRSAD